MTIRRSFHVLWAWIRRRPGAALGLYWVAAFTITHIPPLRPYNPDALPRLIPLDKIVHVGGFAILAWLLMNLLTRRIGTIWSILLTVLLCAIYGVVDELTQPLFNRTADIWDWVADMAGCGVGLAFFLFGSRVEARMTSETRTRRP